MNDILQFIKNIFDTFINNDNYINFISIIVVAITTYHVTKYTTLKPNRLAIKQSQLENVYLPLHLLLINLPQSVSKSNALAYSKKISNILDKHHILAFPTLHSLNQSLKSNIIKNSEYDKILHIIKHQVDIDYELLRKALGYPCESFRTTFKRMTLKQKFYYLAPWIDAFWLFIPLIFSCVFMKYLGKYIILFIFGIIILTELVLYGLKSFIDSLEY